MPIQGDHVFPDSTLTDWTSFADHVVAFEVTSEMILPPPASSEKHREPYVGRRVTLGVRTTVWSSRYAPPLPEPIETIVMGWVWRDACSEMLPAYVGYDTPGPRLEVGGRYVAALVKYTKNGNDWGVLTLPSVFADGADPVATEDIARTGNNSVARSFTGLSLEDVAAKLKGTEPYPAVADHLELPAEERLARYYMAMP